MRRLGQRRSITFAMKTSADARDALWHIFIDSAARHRATRCRVLMRGPRINFAAQTLNLGGVCAGALSRHGHFIADDGGFHSDYGVEERDYQHSYRRSDFSHRK